MTTTQPASQRRQPPISYPWGTLKTLPDLAKAVLHYLSQGATLTSGVPGSLDRETDSVLSGLTTMCENGFITLSSQPGLKAEKIWQRFYVTGILPADKAPLITQSLQSHNFITLVSNTETTTMHLPASLPPLPPSTSPTPPKDAEPKIPLTVTRAGLPSATFWRSMTDIPLPDKLENLMEGAAEGEKREVVMEDEGSLFEHHFDVNFAKFKLKKSFLRTLMREAVVVTLVWPEWGDTEGPMSKVLEVIKKEMEQQPESVAVETETPAGLPVEVTA
ncbi:hypothetical protein PhCBS80983_g04574 [Powellomyces hirtus]|uniref:DUF6919 domain-containing protein n=1 Tax=Powellomyces hirtus TaxID=109895 RepID=A0A507DZV1_9FUNG|nr:hypothetical protein PhCBS80983_g04574 [Powellomyces hirtus]